MRLKTYFASGIDAAMNLARTELGDDALLVHSRRTSGESTALGAYEVVFASTAYSVSAEAPHTHAPAAAPKSLPAAPAAGQDELASLRDAVEMTLRLARRSEALLLAQSRGTGEFAGMDAALEDAGFGCAFRGRVLQEMQNAPLRNLRTAVAQWMQQRIRVQSAIGKPGSMRRCLAVLGPPGAGKSLSLIKIAARFGVTGRRPAQILSIDTERIGGIEGTRAYANVLGIAFQAVDSTHALAQALAEHANKDLVLIDTPGLTAPAAEIESDLSGFLQARPEIDRHLVLPASASAQTLARTVQGFARFQPDKLLFTRLDEAETRLGPMLEAAIQSGLPVSFTSAGTRTPEDLEDPAVETWCETVLPDWLETGPRRSKQAAA